MSEYNTISHGWQDYLTGDIVEEWYSPGEVLFLRPHMIWLLTYLDMLELGEWPPLPHGDEFRNHSLQPNAYFTTPNAFAAEVTYRLDQTGEDGVRLRLYYKPNTTVEDMAHVSHMNYSVTFYALRGCINYISGQKRRKESYNNAKRKRRKWII